MRRDLRFHSNELDLMGELSVPCNRLSPPFHGGCEVRNSRSAIGLNESKDEPKVQRHPAAMTSWLFMAAQRSGIDIDLLIKNSLWV